MEVAGHASHPEQWWAQLVQASERFDAAYVVEELAALIAPLIAGPLLRREIQRTTDTVMRHLTRPAITVLAEQAAAAATRLTATVDRIRDRSADSDDTALAMAMCHALLGRYAAAAAAAEPLVDPAPLRRVFVTALRLERFDISLATRLLAGGRSPAEAIRAATLVGHYLWWPTWLLQIITERAVAGTLDEDTVTALDTCAYASLGPVQAHLARKLLGGDPRLMSDAAQRLEGMGEPDAAERLRQGDLVTVALAARLMSQ